jgi:hypothetical protein
MTVQFVPQPSRLSRHVRLRSLHATNSCFHTINLSPKLKQNARIWVTDCFLAGVSAGTDWKRRQFAEGSLVEVQADTQFFFLQTQLMTIWNGPTSLQMFTLMQNLNCGGDGIVKLC